MPKIKLPEVGTLDLAREARDRLERSAKTHLNLDQNPVQINMDSSRRIEDPYTKAYRKAVP